MLSRIILTLCVVLALTVGLQAQYHMNRLEILPSDVTIKAGHSLEFTVIAHTPDGTMFTPNNVRWTTTGGNIEQNGVFHAGNISGNYTVTVMQGHYTATARVYVKSDVPPIVRLTINPASANVNIGQTVQFTAYAYNMYNQPVSFNPIWRVSSGPGTIHGNGLFRATGMGQAVVTVTPEGINMSANATVNIGQTSNIVRIEISPSYPTIYPGQSMQFRATAYNAYNQAVPCSIGWRTDGGTINYYSGLYQAPYNSGYYHVYAQDLNSGAQGSTDVTIGGSGPMPPTPTPGGDARIVITNIDVGGNFLTPKVKMSLEVYGRHIQTVRLYAITHNGASNELDAQNCKNGDKVYLKAEFDRFSTKYFEVRLYDNMGREVARSQKNPY